MSWRILSFFLAFPLLLAGCNKSSGAAGTGSLSELRLGYFANVTHAQAVLAVASGDLQAALGPGVRLKPKVFNAGPDLIWALNAGEIDIGYVGPGPVLSGFVSSDGQALRVISGAAANGVAIVAAKDSGIHSLADLKGRRLATPQYGNTQDISARHYLTAILGQSDADNVEGIPNSQQAGMMARGKIDAAWVPEPWGARLIDQTGAILVGEEKDLWPNHEFALTVIITSPKFLTEHPQTVEKVLAVHHRWTLRLTNSPAACAGQLNAALAALGGRKLPDQVMQSALARTKFTDDPLPETFSTMERWSHDLRFIKSTPSLAGLFDTHIIDKIAGVTAAPAR